LVVRRDPDDGIVAAVQEYKEDLGGYFPVEAMEKRRLADECEAAEKRAKVCIHWSGPLGSILRRRRGMMRAMRGHDDDDDDRRDVLNKYPSASSCRVFMTDDHQSLRYVHGGSDLGVAEVGKSWWRVIIL
jgi:hypothetical protein